MFRKKKEPQTIEELLHRETGDIFYAADPDFLDDAMPLIKDWEHIHTEHHQPDPVIVEALRTAITKTICKYYPSAAKYLFTLGQNRENNLIIELKGKRNV